MAARCPDELVCDMAQTYHVLDWRALGLPLAATLAAGLRENSRCRMVLAGAVTDVDTLLLGHIADALQLLVWVQTKDGQHGRNRPASMVDVLLGTKPKRRNTGFASGEEYEAARARILKGG